MSEDAPNRTIADVKRELDDVEDRLAQQQGLRQRSGLRKMLLQLDANGDLPLNDLRDRWMELYSIYADWLAREAQRPPPTKAHDDESKGAADAALSFFVALCSVRMRLGRCLRWLLMQSRLVMLSDSFRA